MGKGEKWVVRNVWEECTKLRMIDDVGKRRKSSASVSASEALCSIRSVAKRLALLDCGMPQCQAREKRVTPVTLASSHLDLQLRPSLHQSNMLANSQNIIVKDSPMINVGHDYVCLLCTHHALINLSMLQNVYSM